MKDSEGAAPPRIVGYDLARALAVFGMVVVNFKLVLGADREPRWLADLVGLLEGRAAATFVVLAGVGISLMSRSALEAGDQGALARVRGSLLRRAGLLFVIGLLYTPIWPADILHFYGVYIALAAFLLGASSRVLGVCSALLVSGFVVLLMVFDYERGWDWETLSYEGFWTPDGMLRHLFFNGFHPAVPWAAFVLIGMILARQSMYEARTRRRVFLGGATVALLAEGLSALLIRWSTEGASEETREIATALLGTAPMPPMPLYMLAGSGVACAVIALSVEVGARWPKAAWLRPFIATGQLALTLYVAHVVVGMGTLEALGRLENQTLPFAVTSAAIFCVASVIFAHSWREKFRRGPLEALLRRATAG